MFCFLYIISPQEQEELEQIAHTKLGDFVNSRLQQYFTYVEQRIEAEVTWSFHKVKGSKYVVKSGHLTSWFIDHLQNETKHIMAFVFIWPVAIYLCTVFGPSWPTR